jgi:hypothetical protein
MDSMGGLLTNGLGTRACCGLITTKFNLGLLCISIEPIPDDIIEYNGGVAGGSEPIPLGTSFQRLQQPVRVGTISTPTVGMPYVQYQPQVPLQPVKITITVNNTNFSKDYVVPKSIPNAIIKVVKITNTLSDKINNWLVTAKRIPHKIKILVDKYTKIK